VIDWKMVDERGKVRGKSTWLYPFSRTVQNNCVGTPASEDQRMGLLSSLCPVKRPSLKDRKRCGTVSFGPCAMRVKGSKGCQLRAQVVRKRRYIVPIHFSCISMRCGLRDLACRMQGPACGERKAAACRSCALLPLAVQRYDGNRPTNLVRTRRWLNSV
jgi:hypothetical protein